MLTCDMLHKGEKGAYDHGPDVQKKLSSAV